MRGQEQKTKEWGKNAGRIKTYQQVNPAGHTELVPSTYNTSAKIFNY